MAGLSLFTLVAIALLVLAAVVVAVALFARKQDR